MMMQVDFDSFIERLSEQIRQPLPGHKAQEKMSPEHRLPHTEWKRYFPNARLGGVLILFYPVEGDTHTVLIQRPEYSGVHSGQVAFPGGQKEDSDKNIEETALREASEEIGVNHRSLSVLGRLTELYIPPSNFLITPTVAFAENQPQFILDRNEVAGIIEPSVNELTDEKATGITSIRVQEEITIQAPYYNIRDRIVWGATAMIISELNEILRKVLAK